MAESENNEGCIDDKKGNSRFVPRVRGGVHIAHSALSTTFEEDMWRGHR
jgi:hypothetical protein